IALDAPASVEANRAFDVGWSGDGNRGDLIHMVIPGETSGKRYRYIDPLEPTVTLTAPESPGAYELVYLTHGGAEMARAAIEVTPAPSLPGQLEVLHRPGAGFGAGDAVQIILDASGSMLQRQDGTRRIEIAKRTLTDLVSGTIPPGTGFALRVFGNREADACRTDLEIPLGPLDPARAAQVISGITAVNLAKTPIADSVALSASDLSAATGQRMLILVTDGEETCDGD
ncbi:VWA domain-containing protein, partial [Cribrihabitans sp. XS_ASV171]